MNTVENCSPEITEPVQKVRAGDIYVGSYTGYHYVVTTKGWTRIEDGEVGAEGGCEPSRPEGTKRLPKGTCLNITVGNRGLV